MQRQQGLGSRDSGVLGVGRASLTNRYSPGWKSMTCTLKSWSAVCGSSLRSANTSPGTGSTGCASVSPCSTCAAHSYVRSTPTGKQDFALRIGDNCASTVHLASALPEALHVY